MAALQRFRAETGREPSPRDVVLMAGEMAKMSAADAAATSFVLAEVVAGASEVPGAEVLRDADGLRRALLEQVLPRCEDDKLACTGSGEAARLELKSAALAEAHEALRKGDQQREAARDVLDDEAALRDVAFQRGVSNLKRVKRTGWVLRDVPDPESVSDHSFGVALAALLVDDDAIDTAKAVQMGLLHDVAEAIVGDIAPGQGVADSEKHALEQAAMRELLEKRLGGGARAERIGALWQEYEARETAEARLVKDLDRWEMILTADGYERDAAPEKQAFLNEFYEGVRGKIKHPRVQAWQAALEKEREDRLAQSSSPSS